jgi:hypothetical protein
MKKEVAEKWVKALRSGDYKQGRGSLKGRGRYCCLGVLCDLSEQGVFVRGEYRKSKESLLYSDKEAPGFVRTWAAMKRSANELLIRKNDGSDKIKKHSFVEIANFIEKNWKKL